MSERPSGKKTVKKYEIPPRPVTSVDRTLKALWLTMCIWLTGGLVILLLMDEAARYALFWLSIMFSLFGLTFIIVKRFMITKEKSDLNE